MATNEFITYASALLEDTCGDGEVQRRLKLYQVFLKLYERHQGLLDEILSLENLGGKAPTGSSQPYIQGMVLGQQVCLMTNLLQEKTQALVQPQHIWTIGRDPRRVGICIQDNRLSRCHAAIQYIKSQGFYLVDLNSRNGSIVNGEPIRQSIRLRDGDRIRLGSVSFTFFLCQTVKTLAPLPSEVETHLEDWQLLTAAHAEANQDNSTPEQTVCDVYIPNPLEETYVLEQLGRLKDSLTAQSSPQRP